MKLIRHRGNGKPDIDKVAATVERLEVAILRIDNANAFMVGLKCGIDDRITRIADDTAIMINTIMEGESNETLMAFPETRLEETEARKRNLEIRQGIYCKTVHPKRSS